jgi:hypothetical protein
MSAFDPKRTCEHLRRELEKPAVCAALSLGRDLALFAMLTSITGFGSARERQIALPPARPESVTFSDF